MKFGFFVVQNKHEIRLYSVAMALLHLLYEGNAGRSEVQGHNSICIRSEKYKNYNVYRIDK